MGVVPHSAVDFAVDKVTLLVELPAHVFDQLVGFKAEVFQLSRHVFLSLFDISCILFN